MAVPTINWESWSAPTIAPKMKVVMHFSSGNVTYEDTDIESININGSAFDTSNIVFGSPVPVTGSINIIDYNQNLNPTYNGQLVEGVQVDVLLGLGADTIDPDSVSTSGMTNLVQSYSPSTLAVSYHGTDTNAAQLTTKAVLNANKSYLLRITYKPSGGSSVTKSAIFTPIDGWPASTKFAIVLPTVSTVSYLFIGELEDSWQPYGVFYAEEWSYDSEGSTATVSLVDGMSQLLLLDNRIDSMMPSKSVLLKTFLQRLLTLYTNNIVIDPSLNPTETVVFYEATEATTICECCAALASNLYFLPDGTLVLGKYSGYYNTGITLTDDDVESYTIMQTSALSADGAVVDAMIPSYIESDELATYSDITLTSSSFVPISDGKRVYTVDYIACSASGNGIHPMYSWNVAGITLSRLNNATSTTTYSSVSFDMFKIRGTSIEFTAIPSSNVASSLPYNIAKNPYIQSTSHALQIATIIDTYLAKRFNVVTFTIRGCAGLWLGAKLHIHSERYGIDADYTIISIDFVYNGAVSTTFVAQRVS